MIHITRSATNYIYTTLKEKRSTATTFYYLIECENVFTKSKKYIIPKSIPVATDRYEKLEIQETSSEDAAGGKIKLEPTGTWHYTIYEQTSSTNLDPDNASVVGTLERGILDVSTATEEVSYDFHTETETNYIHTSDYFSYPPFAPTDLDDLDLWYDFSTVSGDDGDDIATFANHSAGSSNYSLTGHVTAGKKPTVDVGTLNLKSAQFDGGDRFTLDNVYATTGETFTVFWVIKKDNVAENDILISGTENTPTSAIKLATANALTTQFNGEQDSDSDNAAVNLFVNNTDNGTANEPFTTAPNIYIFVRTADEVMKLYSKDNFVAQGTSASAGDETTNFRIEQMGASANMSASLTAHIGEVGVYNQALSDDDRASLMTYLKAKWSIS